MVEPVTLAATGAGSAALGAWVTKLLIRRTLKQFDDAIVDVGSLKIKMAVQETVAQEIIKPLRAEVAELRERLAKAEAALAKGWDADKKLQSDYQALLKHVKGVIDTVKGGAK